MKNTNLINHLALIENSINSNLFRNYYIFDKESNKHIDVIEDGNLACAVYVSSILTLEGLIEGPHATCTSTVADLIRSGWIEVDEPIEGCVIYWDEVMFDNNQLHEHVGFYVGNNKAISNIYSLGTPQKHHYLFEDSDKPRTVKKYFFHNSLK